MMQLPADADSGSSVEVALPRKRQRTSSRFSGEVTCSPPAGSDEATVPSQRRMAGSGGSCSHLLGFDTWVPDDQASRPSAADCKPYIAAAADGAPQPVTLSQESGACGRQLVTAASRALDRQRSGTDIAYLSSLDGIGGSGNSNKGSAIANQPMVEQIAAFQRPHLPLHPQTASDIVSGVEFSGDGWFVATAGIRKQVQRLTWTQFEFAGLYVN